MGEENKIAKSEDKKPRQEMDRWKNNLHHGMGPTDYLLMLGLLLLNLALMWPFFSMVVHNAFSAPVVPMLAALFGFFGVGYDAATWWVLLAFYMAGPVTVYLLVREITGRRMSATAAALLYSLPLFRSRFEAMVLLGDGAHIAALTLIPLAAYWLLWFLKSGSYLAAVASSIGVLLVALTSPFGLFVLMAVLTVVTFSEMLLGTGRLKFLRFALVLVLSAGLSAFWYNPEFVRLTLFSPSGEAVMAALKNLIPLSSFTAPILGTFGFLIFDKRPHLQPLFVALGLTIVFGLIAFAGGLVPIAVSVQSRYLPELSMAIAFLWGVVGTFVFDLTYFLPVANWFPIPRRRRPALGKGLVGAFVVTWVILAIFFPHRATLDNGNGRVVLGITTPVITGIGEIREQTGTLDRLVGYSISVFTVLAMGGMYWWLKQHGLVESKVLRTSMAQSKRQE